MFRSRKQTPKKEAKSGSELKTFINTFQFITEGVDAAISMSESQRLSAEEQSILFNAALDDFNQAKYSKALSKLEVLLKNNPATLSIRATICLWYGLAIYAEEKLNRLADPKRASNKEDNARFYFKEYISISGHLGEKALKNRLKMIECVFFAKEHEDKMLSRKYDSYNSINERKKRMCPSPKHHEYANLVGKAISIEMLDCNYAKKQIELLEKAFMICDAEPEVRLMYCYALQMNASKLTGDQKKEELLKCIKSTYFSPNIVIDIATQVGINLVRSVTYQMLGDCDNALFHFAKGLTQYIFNINNITNRRENLLKLFSSLQKMVFDKLNIVDEDKMYQALKYNEDFNTQSKYISVNSIMSALVSFEQMKSSEQEINSETLCHDRDLLINAICLLSIQRIIAVKTKNLDWAFLYTQLILGLLKELVVNIEPKRYEMNQDKVKHLFDDVRYIENLKHLVHEKKFDKAHDIVRAIPIFTSGKFIKLLNPLGFIQVFSDMYFDELIELGDKDRESNETELAEKWYQLATNLIDGQKNENNKLVELRLKKLKNNEPIKTPQVVEIKSDEISAEELERRKQVKAKALKDKEKNKEAQKKARQQEVEKARAKKEEEEKKRVEEEKKINAEKVEKLQKKKEIKKVKKFEEALDKIAIPLAENALKESLNSLNKELQEKVKLEQEEIERKNQVQRKEDQILADNALINRIRRDKSAHDYPIREFKNFIIPERLASFFVAVEKFIDIDPELKAVPVFVYGGFCRDGVQGLHAEKKYKQDVDIILPGVSYPIELLSNIFGKTAVIIKTSNTNLYKVKFHDGEEWDVNFDLRLNGGGNLFNKLKRIIYTLDFFMNTLFLSTKKQLLDITGKGVYDAQNKILTPVINPYKLFIENPICLFRTFYFVARDYTPRNKELFRAVEFSHQNLQSQLMYPDIQAQINTWNGKLFCRGQGLKILTLLRSHFIFNALFPEVDLAITQNQFLHDWLLHFLNDADKKIISPFTVNDLYAAFVVIVAIHLKNSSLEKEFETCFDSIINANPLFLANFQAPGYVENALKFAKKDFLDWEWAQNKSLLTKSGFFSKVDSTSPKVGGLIKNKLKI